MACGRGESPAFRHGSAPLLAPHRAPRVLRQERSPAGSAHSILSRFLRPRFSMFRSVVGRALLGGCTFRLLERRARDGCASGDTSTRCWRRDRFVAFLHDAYWWRFLQGPVLGCETRAQRKVVPPTDRAGPAFLICQNPALPLPPRASPFASAGTGRLGPRSGIGTPTPTAWAGDRAGARAAGLGRACALCRTPRGGRESKPVVGVPPVGASAV